MFDNLWSLLREFQHEESLRLNKQTDIDKLVGDARCDSGETRIFLFESILCLGLRILGSLEFMLLSLHLYANEREVTLFLFLPRSERWNGIVNGNTPFEFLIP